MGTLDVASLLEPVSASEPCGPDLDLEGDPQFLQAVSRIEGLMPASFFTRDEAGRQQVFDRARIDFAAETKTVAGLLERSRDLRLLTLFTRLSALNRDLPGLASGLAATAALLETRWADVHPRGEDGDFSLRSAVLQAFDDMPTVVLPLQHVPLAESRRFGQVSFRSVLIADGEAAAPEGGEPIDRATIERSLADGDLADLRANRVSVGTIVDAAGTIYATMVTGASFEEAARLERLTALAGRIASLLDRVLSARDPGAGAPSSEAADTSLAPEHAGSTAPAGGTAPGDFSIATMTHASAALTAVARYLVAFEPSSLAELLVRQSQSLVGKSFLDVLRTLVPNHAEDARIAIGPDRVFELSFGQLTTVQDLPLPEDEGAGVVLDEPTSEPVGSATFVVNSRRQATDLIGRVAGFYRAAEPSSPIPLLLDRAASSIERDFLSILKDVLPVLGRRDRD